MQKVLPLSIPFHRNWPVSCQPNIRKLSRTVWTMPPLRLFQVSTRSVRAHMLWMMPTALWALKIWRCSDTPNINSFRCLFACVTMAPPIALMVFMKTCAACCRGTLRPSHPYVAFDNANIEAQTHFNCFEIGSVCTTSNVFEAGTLLR